MLGGVTVNFLLAIFLFIVMLSVWGTNYVTKDSAKYGYGVTKTLENYGFEQGDKIISIDGELIENITIPINKYLMFRDINNMKVEHVNGEVEIIKLPEDIGTQLFEAGDLPGIEARYPFEVDSIEEGSPAEKSGMLSGDKIIAINGRKVEYFSDYTYGLKNNSKKDVSLQILRGNQKVDMVITPNEDNKMGFFRAITDEDYITFHNREYTLAESIKGGFSQAYWEIKDYLAQFKYIFTKKGATQIGGFAAIGKMFPSQWNWEAFWYLTAFLSIMLGVLNLLPIPALDGGHVMFLLYEMISGRKPGDKFMEYAQMVGFFILIALVLFANGNDIYKAIFD
jgi:regulator of sigma E protease